MRERLRDALREIRSLTGSERVFVLFSLVVGFCISGEYAITRPASHALFISTFSSERLPWLWLAIVPLNLLAIFLYNRLLPRLGPLKMYAVVSVMVVLVNASAFILVPIFPQYIFVQCAWKDIYILLMFKQLWSMIHTTVESHRAKYLYGLIFSAGTIGSCIGSTIPGLWAASLGSEKLFLFTAPIYCLQFLAYRAAFRKSLVSKKTIATKESVSGFDGLSLVLKNRLLIGILLLVVFMQSSVGFMDYRFNLHLEKHIFDSDARTSYCAWLFGCMNLLSLAFQAVGSFLIIHTIGVRRTHFLIPFLLLIATCSFWMVPEFALVAFAYVFLKATDFSLFSIGREMLYIPLSLDEKFRAKSVIDVFAYRSSKALVSLGILGLQSFAGVYLFSVIDYVSVSIFILWMCAVAFFLYPAFSERTRDPV